MYTLTQSVLCLFLLNNLHAELSLDTYYEERENLIASELAKTIGAKIILTQDEIQANEILMREKNKEVDFGFQNPRFFNMSKPYYVYRDDVKNSKVYQIIRQMPKGAVLHVHASAMMSPDYMISLTYDDNLYGCRAYGHIKLHFSESVPQLPCPTKWHHLKTMRRKSGNPKMFDEELKQQFMLKVNQLDDVSTIWEEFNRVFRSMKQLLHFRPVREKFFYDALKRFYDDNILYVEIRTGLDELYELDGTVHNKTYLATLYHDVANEFVKDYPDFIGVKMIMSKGRQTNIHEVRKSLQATLQMKEEMPDFIVGYDLVAQEDLGKPLVDFLPALAEVKDKIDFYFHGGETNWFGSPSDENLVDAILLGTKRIGHGYALMKHSSLIEAVRSRDIAIEVNVISNNVLALVRDVRNHPLAFYLSAELPVVLASDDPGIWESDPMSDDFYVAFTGIASRRADIRLLKQLAINSIRYSAMNNEMKYKAFDLFSSKWDKFINNLIKEDRDCETDKDQKTSEEIER